jgi:hypothetical protein
VPELIHEHKASRGKAQGGFMPDTRDAQLQEVTILTRAVENVFRKLIRFLVGKISLVKLQEMISYIYVQEAEIQIRDESTGKNIPLTKLAILTGLDTRAIASVREKIEASRGEFQQSMLKELTPESAIVEAWSAQIKKQPGKDSQKNRNLKFGSENADFEKLVRATINMRGVTTQSLIQILLATKSISLDKKHKSIRLLVDHYSPYLSKDEPNMVNAAFSAVSNMISTIEFNVTADVEDRLFQRQVWTFRLPPKKLMTFRAAMRTLLKDMEQQAKDEVKNWEATKFGDDLISAGVGFYYFEDIPRPVGVNP